MTYDLNRTMFRVSCERIWRSRSEWQAEGLLHTFLNQVPELPFRDELKAYLKRPSNQRRIDIMRKAISDQAIAHDWAQALCDTCGIPLIKDSGATYYQETWGIPTVYCDFCRKKKYPNEIAWYRHVLKHNQHLLLPQYRQDNLEQLSPKTIRSLIQELKQSGHPAALTITKHKA